MEDEPSSSMANASEAFLPASGSLPRTPCSEDSASSLLPRNPNFSRFRVSGESAQEIGSGSLPSPLELMPEREELDIHWSLDEFLICPRMSIPSPPMEYSVSVSFPADSQVPRAAGSESVSDSDNHQILAIADVDDGKGRDQAGDDLELGAQLRIEEFEWEEVDTSIEGRDLISISFVGDDEGSETIRELEHRVYEDVAWEVLPDALDLGGNAIEDEMAYYPDEATSDLDSFEVLTEDVGIKACPPAAKSAVESLPSVLFAAEDVARSIAMCAVCKDEFSVNERLKMLPCSHLYHENCLLPWLAIRNSCPLCRFELPTDDLQYESWKEMRAAATEEEGDELSQPGFT